MKSENERGYYILDVVNEAIDRGLKIRFQYADYSTKKRKILRHDGAYYIVSPYALVWGGDMRILGPEEVKEEFREMCRKVTETI